MSYDPFDKTIGTLLDDILNGFNNCPKRTQKMLLIQLFDKISSLEILLDENRIKGDSEEIKRIIEDRFDVVEEKRLKEIREFLYSVMSKELP